MTKTKWSLPNLLLLVVIPVHLFVLVIYMQNNRSTQLQVRRDAMIQQVMNVIHMVQATPWPQIPKAIDALDQSKMHVAIDDKPKYERRTYNLAFWIINRLVPKNARKLEISLHLYNGQWLNIDAEIIQGSLVPQALLLMIEAVIAVVIFLYIWSLNRFIRPLQDFQRTAEKLGVDVHSAYFKEYQSGPKVVRETARAMSRMQKRIQDLLDNRNTMLAAISHDLRTPITRFRLRLEKLAPSVDIDEYLSDLDEMEQMISDILAFARNDHVDEDKTWLDLNALVGTICHDCIDMGWPVSFESSQRRIPVHMRKIAIKRAITNLINNAVKYGKLARVSIQIEQSRPVLIIEDEGPGIAADELEFVFAPFYRCDRSRSRKIAGTGLGLAVARDAVRANSGEIVLENSPSGGLCVKIYF